MQSILFNVRPGLERERRQRFLHELEDLPEVRKVVALDPESPSEIVRRMCYAQVTDEADIQSLLRQIRDQPEVESVEVPAQRGLV